jgi:NADPH:quinone reductase-like Zn-dependent oxidoreductase
MEAMGTSLGASVDGPFRQYGVYPETGLIRAPDNLDYLQASTLSCAGLTAWNALYGGDKLLSPGDTVLVQGTGGVSIFVLQVYIHASSS